MRQRLAFLLAVAVAVTGGVGVASAITGGGTPVDGGAENVSVAERDGTPNQQGTRVVATTQRPDGDGQLGVVVYRNQADSLCFASGVLRGDKIGAEHQGGFRELPLKFGSSCGANPDPVAFSLRRVVDNPKTETDDAHSVFAGVADADVEAIEVKPLDSTPRTVTPSPEGAFIAAFDEPVTGATILRVRLADSTEKVISVPASPGAQKFLESTRRNAPKPGADAQHP
jgi:hypothetical protein